MKKNIIRVIIANGIFLVVGVLSNFILPKYLPIETYSDLKLYTLYLSYAGFFTLGYADGIFLKYGGKNLNKISGKDYYNDFNNFFYLQIVMSILLLGISMFIKQTVLLFFSIGIIFENTLWYCRLVYQATAEFKDYNIVLNAPKVLIFLIDIVALFLLKKYDSITYLLIIVIVTLLVSIYIVFKTSKKYHKYSFSFINFKLMLLNCKNGFILMIGNFANTMFTGIDRWFVKILFSTKDFAIYAFAVSMENIINLFVTPISISMYSYLCNNHSSDFVLKIKRVLLLWGALIISLAFPAKFVLERYLTNYIDASNIIFLLFATQLAYSVIKGVYLNIYKVYNQQKKYLIETIVMIIIAIILNIVLYNIRNTIESFAIATFITSLIWLIICEILSKEYRYKIKEILYIILINIAYFISGFMFNSVIGFIVYFIFYILISLLLLRNTFLYLISCISWKKIKKILSNKIHI